MSILPPSSPAPLAYTALDIITDALITNQMIAAGEVPDSETAQWAFRSLNYLIDIWKAKAGYVYAKNFQVFTLTPQLSPHLIGPDPPATFVVPVRPVRIESAALLLSSNGSNPPSSGSGGGLDVGGLDVGGLDAGGSSQPSAGGSTIVDLPITMRDAAWWANQQTKDIQTDIPTDLFYDPTWPNGKCYFWPVPNVAYQVRLQLWITLSEYSQITQPLIGSGPGGTLPPAYRAALMLTLAEMLLPSGGLSANPVLVEMAKSARVALLGNNQKSPRMGTRDYGMPQSGRPRADFNWEIGTYPGGSPE